VEALVTRWWLWLGVAFGIGNDFVIVRDGLQIIVRGRISAKKAADLRAFLRDDFPAEARFAVAGSLTPGRRFRLRWAGRLDQQTRQRLRNMLVEVLR